MKIRPRAAPALPTTRAEAGEHEREPELRGRSPMVNCRHGHQPVWWVLKRYCYCARQSATPARD